MHLVGMQHQEEPLVAKLVEPLVGFVDDVAKARRVRAWLGEVPVNVEPLIETPLALHLATCGEGSRAEPVLVENLGHRGGLGRESLSQILEGLMVLSGSAR